MQLAGFYNRQGEFEKTIEALQQRAQNEPNNPEAFYTMATYYWDKAYRDFRLPDADKIKYVQSGVDAVDKAISLKGDYMEALVYKNLLLRLQANLEKNPARQQALLKEADTFRNRAEELRKQKAAAPAAAPAGTRRRPRRIGTKTAVFARAAPKTGRPVSCTILPGAQSSVRISSHFRHGALVVSKPSSILELTQ